MLIPINAASITPPGADRQPVHSILSTNSSAIAQAIDQLNQGLSLPPRPASSEMPGVFESLINGSSAISGKNYGDPGGGPGHLQRIA